MTVALSLSDQTAIVTGAAQGIGRGIAERLGEAGASVVVADINEDGGEATVEEFRRDGIEATFVEGDVTNYDVAESVANTALDAYGSVDILVNNVGGGARGRIDEVDPDGHRRTVDVCLNAGFNCIRAVSPIMIEQEYGRIVNISSSAGRNISYSRAASYTAGKWGVIGLTRHVAWDLGEYNITCNAVCPGPTSHEATTDNPEWDIERKVPLGRWATPRDHANAVLYLASELGSFVTGSTIDTSGGILLGIRAEI